MYAPIQVYVYCVCMVGMCHDMCVEVRGWCVRLGSPCRTQKSNSNVRLSGKSLYPVRCLHSLCIHFFLLYFSFFPPFYVSVCLPSCMQAWGQKNQKEGVRSPKTQVNSWVWAVMRVLRLRPRSSGRVASVLAISLALHLFSCPESGADHSRDFRRCIWQLKKGSTWHLARGWLISTRVDNKLHRLAEHSESPADCVSSPISSAERAEMQGVMSHIKPALQETIDSMTGCQTDIIVSGLHWCSPQNLGIIVISTVIRVCTQSLLLFLYQKFPIHSEYLITLSFSLILNTSRRGEERSLLSTATKPQHKKSSLKNINTHGLRKTKGEIVWNKFRSPFDSVHWNVQITAPLSRGGVDQSRVPAPGLAFLPLALYFRPDSGEVFMCPRPAAGEQRGGDWH